MSCIECGDSSKYKCPTCRSFYCSVGCYKKHKENPCTPPVVPESTIEAVSSLHNYEFPTEDTVPVEKLKLLENSSELKKCLENPYLREILELLDKAPHPDRLMQDYMQEPIFTEFVDECLKVVEPNDDDNT